MRVGLSGQMGRMTPASTMSLDLFAITVTSTVILSSLLNIVTGTCPAPPPPPPYSSHDAGDGHSFPTDTRVEYTCDYGYRTSGNGVTICQADGTWNRDSLDYYSCNPVNCGDPGHLDNGERDSEVFTFGRELLFTCNSGYHIQGSAWLQCMSDGSWNYPLPSCQAVPCPTPRPPSGGEIFPSVPPFVYKTRITVSCHDEHQQPVPSERMCQANGTWTGTDPVCEDITCDVSYQHLEDGRVAGDTVTVGSVLHFSCNENFTLDGNAYLVCQKPGVWSNTKPICRITMVTPTVPATTPVAAATTTEGQGVGKTSVHTVSEVISTQPPPGDGGGPNQVLTITLGFLGGLVLVLILGLLAWVAVTKCKKDDRGDFKKFCRCCCCFCCCVKKQKSGREGHLALQQF